MHGVGSVVREEITVLEDPLTVSTGSKRLMPPTHRGPSLRKDAFARLGTPLHKSQSERGVRDPSGESGQQHGPSMGHSALGSIVTTPSLGRPLTPSHVFMSPVRAASPARPGSSPAHSVNRATTPSSVASDRRSRVSRGPDPTVVHFLSEGEALAAGTDPDMGQNLIAEWLESYDREESSYASAALAAEVKLR